MFRRHQLDNFKDERIVPLPVVPYGLGIFPNTYWVFKWFYLLMGGVINQVCEYMTWGNLWRIMGNSLFWVKSFVLRRLKKPPDPVFLKERPDRMV